jgi:small subunit ribosomal protein S9
MTAETTKKTTAKAHAEKPAAAKKPAAPRKPRVAKTKEAAKPEVMEAPVAAVTEEVKAPVEVHKITTGKNFYAVGRRKTATAQIMLISGNGTFTVNGGPLEKYFATQELQHIALNALTAVGWEKQMNFKAKVLGGGIHAQAEALRHAIARAVINMTPESRRTLKKLGFLMRDPRVKERKKPGLKRARRAPQFSKR